MRRMILVATALIAIGSAAGAQDSSRFAALRADGNGIAGLRVQIATAFNDTPARDALLAIAAQASLNLTMDPGLPGLNIVVSIPAHRRSVASALLEVAAAGRLSIRVSPSGQLVVRATSAAAPATPRPRDDSASRQLDTVKLPAVRTDAPRIERQTFETSASVGTVSITGRELQAAPRFFAEADLLRAVQLLPGVEARNDYSAVMNVRGGEADQNLILLDGYPIYNPFHLGGVFGTFIEPTVGRVNLLTGGFPSSYGGRLSSVLDVHSAEEPRAGIHGTTNVSLIAATGSLGGALADGKGTWMVAARRTYADAVVGLFKPNGLPYHFQDAQAHVTRALPGGFNVSATAYAGLDLLHASSGETDENFISWGNRVVGATITKTLADHPRVGAVSLGDSALVTQRISASRFNTDVSALSGAFTLHASVADARLGGSLTTFTASHQRTLGYELASQRLSYHANPPVALVPIDSSGERMQSASVFFDDLWRPTHSLMIDVGARADMLDSPRWATILPRVAIKYFATANVAFTAAIGEYAQWIRSLAREDVPIRPLDLWVASDSAFLPSRARHYILGAERWSSATRYVRVEGFYKSYHDLVEPNPFDDGAVRGDEFIRVGGNSYGADVLVRQLESGRFSGWLAYTYVMSTRITPGGVRFFPAQDRRHDLNAVANWRFSKYTLGARYGFATGTPYTAVLGDYERRNYDPAGHFWTLGPDGSRQFVLGPRNGERLPTTHRLDVSVTRNGHARGIAVSPFLSIVNVYNAGNVYAYGYDYTRTPPTRTALPGLPFFPTIGVSIVW